MSLYFDVVDVDQRSGWQESGGRGLAGPGDDGRVRLIREILPFVIAKYGIGPECLHAKRSPEPISAGPSFSTGLRLEQVVTVEN